MKQMSAKYSRTISSLWSFLLLATLCKISRNYVEGLRTIDKSIFGSKPQGTIKTIEALEVGDIIDCVDIYKQPAFDNPLIKEIKMAPSYNRRYPGAFNKTRDIQPKLLQAWTKYGECPKGTIPIRRTSEKNITNHQKYNKRNDHEYASAVQHFNKSDGAVASLNVWQPRVASTEEFSLSQMWVVSGSGQQLDSVEAGWMVYPRLFHDARPRLFIFWSRNRYKKGCYNLMCSGFVQVDEKVALGSALAPVSVRDGQMSVLDVSLTRTRVGDWWLMLNDILVGYFPRQLFKTLGDGADSIAFGGEIINLELEGVHTSTEMGSGHFSAEGYQKASYVSKIKVVNEEVKWVEPNLELQRISRRSCYDLTFGPSGTKMGSHFYFGGPGYYYRRCS